MLRPPLRLRQAIRPLVDPATYRAWVHLLLGGVLLLPYLLVFGSLAAASGGTEPAAAAVLGVLALGLAVAIALVPAVRALCITAARALLDAPLPDAGPPSWDGRRRAAAWLAANVLIGGTLSTLTLIAAPTAATLLVAPLVGTTLTPARGAATLEVPPGVGVLWAPPAAVALLVLLGYAVAGTAAGLRLLAPALLGPSPAERLAELERRTGRLVERARLARELHDSVGHALTVTTVQAGAAARVLDTDPEFARRALGAIEDAGRAALADLDHVLGLLREETPTPAPHRTLADVEELLAATRSAGVAVETELTGPLDTVPAAVSREAYRILQEGLTNALRHAGTVPVTVRVAVDEDSAGEDCLELEMTNPLGGGRPRSTGGRGLAGMRERVAVLRGRMSADADGDSWRVLVRLPLRPGAAP